MFLRNKTRIAAGLAAIFFGAILSGCCTPRQIDEIKARLDRIETKTNQTNQMVANTDSLAAANAEENARLRNELRMSSAEIQQQMDRLLENYRDLMNLLQQQSAQERVLLRSSPGADAADYPSTGPGAADQPPTTPPAIDCDSTYDDSFILLRRGEYENAIDGFRRFIDNCEGHESVENAHYWIGECYYSLEKYAEAVEELEGLLENFKSSANLSRALYKLGRSKEELGKKNEAKQIFQRLVDEYPGTLEAEQAKGRLAELK